MSAAYDAAGKALGVVDEVVHEEPDSVPTSTYALLGIGRALLALTDEVEQVVELLRTLVTTSTNAGCTRCEHPADLHARTYCHGGSCMCAQYEPPRAAADLDDKVAARVFSCTGREDCAGPVHVRGCLATAPPDPRYPPMRTS